MASYEDVYLSILNDNGDFKQKLEKPVKLDIISEQFGVKLTCRHGKQQVLEASVDQKAEMARVGEMAVMLSLPTCPLMLKFASKNDQSSFLHRLKEALKNQKKSVFNERTDAASAEQYFQFYGYLSQQQNMMQDYIRTSTYQRAMLDNTADFNNKVVLDVGAGSGILSFFAVQAGAKKVYAIEASSMAAHCEKLVAHNRLSDKITVIAGKIEEVELPEEVDIIISEPMGYMLFNERMLETYLHAKKWLKPGGLMFPSLGDLHIAPFTDDALLSEQYSKANFWYQPAFHGVDLCCLREASVQEYFKQPIVDTFDIRSCLAQSQKHTVDFRSCHESDLHLIDVPLSFTVSQSGTVHGLAFWFDVAFVGSQSTVWLSTSPTQPLTHWYQVRCLLTEPVFAKQGDLLEGRLRLVANTRQSYDVEIEIVHPSTNVKSTNTLDLKNPFFRYTGQQPAAPPGTNTTSPTDAYWSTQQQADQTVVAQVVNNCYPANIVNGGLVNGGFGDAQIIIEQPAVQPVQQLPSNIIPLANIAPVNPGSIPAATIVSGGGISGSTASTTRAAPAASPQGNNSFRTPNGSSFSVSQQFMIGDYAVPGSLSNYLPGNHPLEMPLFKSQN